MSSSATVVGTTSTAAPARTNRLATGARRLNVIGLVVAVALVASWQLVVDSGLLAFDYLPAPSEIVSATRDLFTSGELPDALLHTVRVTVVSSLLAITLGASVGTVFALSNAVRKWTAASVDVIRTVPVVALMPVALLVWGSSGTTEIIVATFVGFWIMMVNTSGGVLALNARLQDIGRMFQLDLSERVRKLVVPAAASPMLVGARLTVVACFIVCIVAEMLISYQGLGYALIEAQSALQPEQMWSYAIASGVLGYLFNVILIKGARLALPGGRDL